MVRILTAKAITFDIDWAPDFMVEECMEICARAGVSASFYATHPSPILSDIASDPRFELGIHPNFLPGSSHGATHKDVLAYCLDLVPSATSMRTHGLYQSGAMFHELATHFPQIRVDASLFLPGHQNLRAVDFHFYGNALRRLPFCWEDDAFAETPGTDWGRAPVVGEGLSIFAFHPIHVAINTDRVMRYAKLKSATPINSCSPSVAAHYANSGTGVETYLRSLINKHPRSEFMQITEMADASVI
jgi:hypothetical protein